MEETKCVTVSLDVKNFSFMTSENCYLKFYVNCLRESSWCLYISEYDEASISVKLVCDEVKDQGPIMLDFEISLLSESGSVISKERKNSVEFLPRSKNLNPMNLKHDKKSQPVQLKFEKDTLTLKCRLWSSKKHLSFPIFYSAWSQVGMQQTTFNWRIANFKKLKCDGKKRTYDVKNGDELPNFSLELFLKGNAASQADLCLDVRQIRKCIPLVKTLWKVSVLDLEGNTVKLIEFYAKMTPSSPFQAPPLLNKEELSSMKDKILSDNGLNLVFNLTFSTGKVSNAVERVSFLQNQEDTLPEPLSISSGGVFNASSAALQADLLFMYREQTLSDFEIRTGGQTFKVHKNILSARSPVFKAMFSGDMTEASGTGLDVPDVDPETLEFLIMYMYTGTLDPLKCESAIKIYYAADKYEILPLRKICSDFLGSHVSDDTLCEILLMADMHQDVELMSAVNEFIICNDQEIIQSKKWEEFLVNHPLLAAKVMRTVLQKTRYSGERK